ncbi:MAG TPA: NAD(P)-dependent oxidoreductase [Terriglobales bacterium]|nr:NAD(P)-dependent oxidoreductase [Terriglobales bacterium]
MSRPQTAILGLGIMGSGMAHRLLSLNFPLTVYNRNQNKAAPLVSSGATLANTPREAASRAAIVISIVADDRASRDVWLGPEGILAGASAGSVLIESSTLSVGWMKELAASAAKRGCEFLDAPVTGTKPHAASGELVFLVGGNAAALEIARPVLSALGRDVVHLGPHGSGALMKLINNFVCGVQAASFAEAGKMIEAAGLDRQKAFSVLTEGAPGSGIVKRVAGRVLANDFDPNFALQLMAKDLTYALQEGNALGIRLQTATAALEIFRKAIAGGYGEEDFSAVAKVFQRS